MFNKILVATDFSLPSKAALYAGLEMAKRLLVPLHVVYVITLTEDIFSSERFVVPTSEWQGKIAKQLDEFFPGEMYPNSRRKILVGSSVAGEILKYARAEQCGLIVVGSHGRGMIGRALLGSVTQKIARASEIPVMTVRSVEQSAQRYERYERILVPTDFSDTSMKALDLGMRFSGVLKSELHLIHVADLPAMQAFVGEYPYIGLTLPQPEQINVDPTLKKMIESKEFIGRWKVSSLVGDPVREILAYAEEQKIDFIVMGTHGRKGLERLLLGSVTATVLSKSRVPVLTISTPEQESVTIE